MILRTPKEEIENYYNKDAISSSELRLWSNGIYAYENPKTSDLFFEDKTHFNIGNGVDSLLTGGLEDFAEKFYVSNLISKPSEAVMSIISLAISKLRETTDSISIITEEAYQPVLIEAARQENWNPNYGDQAILNNLIKQGSDYWNEILLAGNKTILSKEENDKIFLMADNVCRVAYDHNGGTLINFRNPEEQEQNPNVIWIPQKPIYYMDSPDIKILPDMIIVDKEHQTIRMVELKTFYESTENFTYYMRKKKLYLQFGLYHHVMNKIGISFLKSFLDLEELLEYTYSGLTVIGVSSTFPEDVVVLDAHESLLEVGYYGRKGFYTQGIADDGTFISQYHSPIKGVKELIETLYNYKLRGKNYKKDFQTGTLAFDRVIYKETPHVFDNPGNYDIV